MVQSYGCQLTMASSWELSWAFNEEIFWNITANSIEICIILTGSASNITALELKPTLGEAKTKNLC